MRSTSTGHTRGRRSQRERRLPRRPPAVVNPRVAADTYPLCLAGFATLFSSVTRTLVYSAERLTTARIEAARGYGAGGQLPPEPWLPVEVRSELGDYPGKRL